MHLKHPQSLYIHIHIYIYIVFFFFFERESLYILHLTDFFCKIIVLNRIDVYVIHNGIN